MASSSEGVSYTSLFLILISMRVKANQMRFSQYFHNIEGFAKKRVLAGKDIIVKAVARKKD